MMLPTEAFRTVLQRWAGGLSLDPDDHGNWLYLKGGKKIFTGSKFDITGATLATYRGVDRVSAADIAALTMDDALAIFDKLFWDQPDFDRLEYSPLPLLVADFGWASGIGRAEIALQQMVGAHPDGDIGPLTIQAYHAYVAAHGLEAAGRAFAAKRNAYLEQCVRAIPTNAKYLAGWKSRVAWVSPGGPLWSNW